MAAGASGEDKSSPSPPPSESPKNSPPPSNASAPPPSSSSPPPAPKENDKSPPPPSGSSNSPTNSPPPSKSNDSSPPPPQEKNSPPPANNSSPPPQKTTNAPPPENNKISPPPAIENNKTSPPPANENNSPPPKENNSPPPPNESNNTPPPSDKINAPPPPSNNNNAPLPPSPSIQDNSSQLPPTLALSPPFRSPTENLPAPPKQLSPPKTSSTDDVTPVPGSSHDGTKVAAIASVAVAGGLLILVFAVFVIVCTRKKNKKQGKHMYYGNPPRGGGYYPNNQQNWQNANMSQDYNINLSMPPGGTNGFPPPPPMMSSSETSSGFSGSYGSAIPPLQSSATLGVNQSQFTYEELAAATSGFSQANLLGQGGFGYVHKGVLPNGKEVAVKSLKSGSGQGDREFRAEVEIISRVHHRHLVSLVGFCILNEQKMLVYEFVPNNTLEYHLHGRDHPTLDWSSRLKIALGSARGLAYLHEDCHPRIIHRDIKASNILIDEAFEAKVADFGLAKLSADNFTHVSTRVMGTFGYLAPEYASSGKLTEKSDVFSFGVMLLELITGRRPVDHSGNMEDSLVDWARPLCQRALDEGNYEALVDPSLEGNYAPQEMACMVACAAASIRHSARRRPKMSQVVRALEGDVSLDDLNDGPKPGQSGIHPSSGSSEYDASSYSEDMRKFRRMALGSQEYGSSDNGATSEYGLNPSTSSSDSEATRKNSRVL